MCLNLAIYIAWPENQVSGYASALLRCLEDDLTPSLEFLSIDRLKTDAD